MMRLRLSVRATNAPALAAMTCAMRCLFPVLGVVWRETVQSVCRMCQEGLRPRLRRGRGDSAIGAVLRRVNVLTACNIMVTTVVAAVVCSLGPISGARAETVPTPSDAMEAYRTVRGWVDAGGIDGMVDDVGPVSDTEGLRAACVTMRLDGRVIGRGLSWAGDGRDLLVSAQRAWQRGVESVGAVIGERAAAIALDIELGGEFVPLVGETELDFLSQINPGIDGIAVRAGERIGVTFPGQMLASGWSAQQALMHAIAPLELPQVDFGTLRNRYGLVVYRFETEHLAQPESGAEPVFLHRCGRRVSMGEVSGARILGAAGEAALFLERLAWPGPEPHGIRGDYDPIADSYAPAIAPPASQAIAAWALSVYAQTPGVDAAESARALRSARETLSEFTLATEFEDDPGLDPGALALWLVAMEESGGAGVYGEGEAAERIEKFAEDARAGLLGLADDAERFDAQPGVIRAMVALSLSYGGDEDSVGKAKEIARWLYVETAPGDLVALMPWLGLASERLAADGKIGAEGALREMRSVIERFTIHGEEADAGTDDLVGGVVFTRGRTPLPSWQSLRPVSFLAAMIGDDRLTGAHERGASWLSLVESLRFAMQLQVDETAGHMFVRPEAARGGVRLALWDQRCSVNATALALVSWCEALQSAERVAKAAE